MHKIGRSLSRPLSKQTPLNGEAKSQSKTSFCLFKRRDQLQERTLHWYICLDRLLEYCIVKIRIESIDATTPLSTTCVSIPS